MRRPCIPIALIREGSGGILPYIISNPCQKTLIKKGDKVMLMGEF